ncbi:MAG: ELWxxDGT repeat protein [Planctomycetota bacterium]
MNRIALATAALALGLGATPRAQSLLLDVNRAAATNPLSSQPKLLGEANGWVYFSAWSPALGRELWRTDGTSSNTELVVDLRPGTQSGLFTHDIFAVDASGAVYFAGDDGRRRGLFRTDGTATGTVLATPSMWVDLPGGHSAIAVGADVYFWGDDGVTGVELWKTDGTPGGTTQVANINPSGGAHDFREPMHMRVVGGLLFFRADDGTNGVELWCTDGTAAGTRMVADLNPAGDATPREFYELGGRLLFAAQATGTGNPKWWITDAGATTATRVSDVDALVTFSGHTAAFAGAVYFGGAAGGTGDELWRTDGTAAGTTLVRDIHPSGSSTPFAFAARGGELYFSATDGSSGRELWKTDGTATGTVQVADLEPGSRSSNPSQLYSDGGLVYFYAATSASGGELFASDGTAAGTRVVRELQAGSGHRAFFDGPLAAAQGVVFGGDDGLTGDEPWRTDGTAAGTVALTDIASDAQASNPRYLGTFGDRLIFAANDGITGEEPWVSDGTAAGTRRLLDASPGRFGSVEDVAEWRGAAWITNRSGLLRSDATPSGTTLEVPAFGMGEVEAYADKLFFSGTNFALWETDGTPAGTREIHSFERGLFYPVGPRQMVQAAGLLWMTAAGGSFSTLDAGVFASDGTSSGTRLIAPIFFNLINTAHIEIVPFSAGVLIGTRGQMWFSDGTSTTTLVRWAALPTSPIPAITVVDGVAYFTANDPALGDELWRTDGTPAGTVPVVDLWPGPSSSAPASLTAAGGRVWFSADDGTTGRELWCSDGTAAGTLRLSDAWPGATGSSPDDLAPAGSGARVVFSAVDPNGGREPWVSDGTAAGTRRLADLAPGALPSQPAGFFRLGTTLFFQADNGTTGNEPWLLPLATAEGHLVEAYGAGCPGTAGQVPAIGWNRQPALGDLAFSVDVTDARPSAAAAVLIAFGPGAFPIGGGCDLLLGVPFFAVPWGIDATGRGSRPSGVGNDPALLGAELRYQWIVADPQGALAGVLSLSDALHVMYGR